VQREFSQVKVLIHQVASWSEARLWPWLGEAKGNYTVSLKANHHSPQILSLLSSHSPSDWKALALMGAFREENALII
jgi:hypothetical protein